MKIPVQSVRRRQQGMATVIVLALLSVILIYLSLNRRTISGLQQELKMVEWQQIKRLNARVGATNTAGAVVTGTLSQPASP